MELRAEQIHSHLERAKLAPIYCVSGDEPLQIIETADRIRQTARAQGFEDRTVLDVVKDFDWGVLARENAGMSLFGNRKLIELRLGTYSPGKEGGAALQAFAASANPDNLLLLTSSKLDKKTRQTRWYKSLEQCGVCIQVWPVDPPRLPGWIAQRMKRHGKTIDADAAALIAQRMEGNLLAASQEVDKLALLVDGARVTVDDAARAVSDSARFEVFGMLESAMAGKAARAIRMLRGLRAEGNEAMAIFGPVVWELRRLCSIAHEVAAGESADRVMGRFRVWPQQRRTAMKSALERLSAGAMAQFIRRAARIDRAAKGADAADPWALLEDLLLRLAGVASPSKQP